MTPARRPNFARSRSRSYIASSNVPVPQPTSNQDLMPPSSRYLHNLRVIQRHDPSITSLFDQFPHVCVYHHKGDEWQKKGCEGAMFLFEREEEPKYGFYILNRNNTGDYIQRMTPDDDVEFASAYLIYRAFGKVTSDTIGLWTMVTQDREAMSQVMMRLHSYIKRNVRYPDEYRRQADTWSTTPAPVHAEALPLLDTQPSTQEDPSTSMSALSTLLAKLESPQDSLSSFPPSNRAASASVPPPTTTGIPLLDSIFASASDHVASLDVNTLAPSSAGSVLHASVANDVTTSGPSSASTSCGATPTQHMSQLPSSASPSKRKSPFNGIQPGAAGRGIFPYLSHPVSNGRETAPPVMRASSTSEHILNGKVSGSNLSFSDRRSHPSQYPTFLDSQEREEDGWEEEEITAVNTEGNGNPQSPSRRNRARNAKKRERERERRRSSKRETVFGEGVRNTAESEEDGAHVWSLVDDRSIDLDEVEATETCSLGLGEGLLNALAAVNEPEPHETRPQQPAAPMRRNKERGKDRRKRKHREDASTPQTSEATGDLSSSSSSHPVEVRSAVLDAYGRRRRIGDSVLSETALAKEVIDLINNDPTFVRELHQQYIRKVEV